MPGPPPKPAAKRQGRHRKDVGEVTASITALSPSTPPAPKGLLKATTAKWTAFWQSEVSQLVTPADHPALERLFTLYDERERCLTSARKGRLVDGSQGQPVLNPLYKHMATLDVEIRQMEGQFGLTPMARLKLGVTFGAARKSLADMNAELEADEGDDDDDPRFIDAEVVDI